MRVLQVNIVHEIKSTGRSCKEIEQALIAAGHECCTAYGNGPKNMGEYAYRIDTRIEYLFHNVMSRLTGLEGYFSWFATKRFIRFIDKYQPDVIHLQNIHGHFLHLPLFFKYLSRSTMPVVQTLHDCWTFTGKCAYYSTVRCGRWKEKCGQCPLQHTYPTSWFFDRSRKLRRDKERWYHSLKKLAVVGVSRWVMEEAKQSFLRWADEITYIYNWINQDVFHPYDDNGEIKVKYAIPKDKFMILGVSAIWSKQSPRYKDFMKITEKLQENEVLVMIGKHDVVYENSNVIYIPFVSDTTELAKLYSVADVYVHCSVEDTFGKVIAEAMACGTPAIVYDVTGCPELVEEGGGYAVPPRDVDAIREHIDMIKNAGKQAYSTDCVESVKRRFSYQDKMDEHIALYEKLISEN